MNRLIPSKWPVASGQWLDKKEGPCFRHWSLATGHWPLQCLAFAVLLGAGGSAWADPTLELVQTIVLQGKPGKLDHLIVDSKSQRLFLANKVNNTVDVVDLKEGKLLKQLTGQAGTQGLAYAPDLGRGIPGGGAGHRAGRSLARPASGAEAAVRLSGPGARADRRRARSAASGDGRRRLLPSALHRRSSGRLARLARLRRRRQGRRRHAAPGRDLEDQCRPGRPLPGDRARRADERHGHCRRRGRGRRLRRGRYHPRCRRPPLRAGGQQQSGLVGPAACDPPAHRRGACRRLAVAGGIPGSCGNHLVS